MVCVGSFRVRHRFWSSYLAVLAGSEEPVRPHGRVWRRWIKTWQAIQSSVQLYLLGYIVCQGSVTQTAVAADQRPGLRCHLHDREHEVQKVSPLVELTRASSNFCNEFAYIATSTRSLRQMRARYSCLQWSSPSADVHKRIRKFQKCGRVNVDEYLSQQATKCRKCALRRPSSPQEAKHRARSDFTTGHIGAYYRSEGLPRILPL